MSSDAAHTAMTDTSGDIATVTTPASLADAQDAIPGLLDDIVVTHVLRSEHFGDPADLARLPAVSRAMRDAVAATGLRFKELGEKRAAELGCFSALRQVAARVGNLEKLKLLRANGCPWNAQTCANAAGGGHLDVLQWARANGCPWEARGTRLRARGRRRAGTSMCCSGRGRTAARGTRIRARLRRDAGNLMCCSGRTRTVASGFGIVAKRRRRGINTTTCYRGYARTSQRNRDIQEIKTPRGVALLERFLKRERHPRKDEGVREKKKLEYAYPQKDEG